jgi:hypothetical protein
VDEPKDRHAWRRSTRCGESGQCVEVADLGDAVAVRDAADPDGPVLSFTRSSWTAFVTSLVEGELRPV